MNRNLFHTLFLLLMAVLSSGLTGCSSDNEKYVIGVSQCSEDSWRNKLEMELEQSTYFNEDVQLKVLAADDNVEQQKHQIEQLINEGIDLLIVSPQQTHKLSDAIKKATDKNIPVILFDRKSDVDDYTAFMGADNYSIGKMLGEYVAAQLGGRGNIIEIAGEPGSSPAIERHKGFNDIIAKYPDLKIVGYGEGDWKQESGEKCMEEILEKYNGSIDCVFGANDRIAFGARQVLDRYHQVHGDCRFNPSNIIFVGVDALPTSGGGIEKVKQGKITASAIYPTHGDDLMNLALCILRGESFDKTNNMETSLVTQDNAEVLLLQYKEIVKQDEYIKKMHNRVDSALWQLGWQKIILWGVLFVTLVIALLLGISIRTTRTKHHLNEVLRQKNEELNKQKERVEQQRDELEEQRDKLLDATTKPKTEEELAEDEDKPEKNEFMKRFMTILDKHISNYDLSVEDLGHDMCLSRVQLYRKVKTMTGKTPVEIIREERLKRAKVLLDDTSLSVSEVAYRVGFSSPSYFTKCYKDLYGKSPTA